MSLDRRGFLQSLGLAVGAITISPHILSRKVMEGIMTGREVLPDFIFPQQAVPYSGIVTPQWIVAETLREITLNNQIKDRKFIHVDKQTGGIGSALMVGGVYTNEQRGGEGVFTHQICGNFQFSEEEVGMPLDEFREKHIIPCAKQIANEIAARENLKYCGKLVLPNAIEFASQVTDSLSGLDLRFIRAYDIVYNCFVNRFDLLLG
jgi:hypothetical protein